jgi:hypothetical protein
MEVCKLTERLERAIDLHSTRKEDEDAPILITELTINVTNSLRNEVVVDAKSDTSEVCRK